MSDGTRHSCFTMDNSEWKHWLKKYILSVFTELFYLIKKALRAFGDKKATTNNIKVAKKICDVYKVDYFEVE